MIVLIHHTMIYLSTDMSLVHIILITYVRTQGSDAPVPVDGRRKHEPSHPAFPSWDQESGLPAFLSRDHEPGLPESYPREQITHTHIRPHVWANHMGQIYQNGFQLHFGNGQVSDMPFLTSGLTRGFDHSFMAGKQRQYCGNHGGD